MNIDLSGLTSVLTAQTEAITKSLQDLPQAGAAGGVTLAMVAEGLPLRASSELRRAVAPLAATNVAACDVRPRDLTSFWKASERALLGLGAELKLNNLRREHLHQLGPHLLGEVIWGAIEHREFDTWFEMQALVDERWGLSPEQRRGAFFGLRPKTGECFESFVIRVEDERR